MKDNPSRQPSRQSKCLPLQTELSVFDFVL